MGCRNRELPDYEASTSSFSEALLFATMCIIGLPVDVHVKDGSVYSGIFYTASVENDYGIVLKKARMTKRGKNHTNIGKDEFIDTLVIQSGDLVQVVAKGVLPPADGVAGNLASNNSEATMVTIQPNERPENHAKEFVQQTIDIKKTCQVRSPLHNANGITLTSIQVDGRQAEYDWSQREHSDFKEKQEGHREKSVDDVQGSCSSLNTSIPLMKPVEGSHTRMASKLLSNRLSCDPTCASVKLEKHCCERFISVDTFSSAVTLSVSTLSNPAMVSESCHISIATSTEMVPCATESNRSTKEFKLNPGAKTFSPSYTNPLLANPPAAPMVTSLGYAPNNPPLMPVGTAQLGNGLNPFVPHSSVHVKGVPYGNLTSGNGVTAPHLLQPIAGQVGSRMQPLRAANQYPIQAGATYAQPNSQAVMVGRFGQLLYVHPVSQDLVPGATAISPLAARPLLAPQQVQHPKHQASAAGQALQLCMPPFPVVSSGQQPFAMPCHIPLPHFPYNRPIPGCNGLLNSKFA